MLQKNGLIKSDYNYGEHNLFIYPITKGKSYEKKEIEENQNCRYQKINKHVNSRLVFQKNSLYKCYLSMKKLFFEDFNFMPETYNYPEEKK